MKGAPASIRCAAPVAARLGEGPLWDPRIGRLLFVDIKGEKLFLFDPATTETKTFAAPGAVSAIGLRRKGGYVCARKDGFGFLAILGDEISIKPLGDPEEDRSGNRFNDGKVDPLGGFWAGTMDEKEEARDAGAFWRLAPDGAILRLDDKFHVTNGPAFDPALARVYFTDSARRVIYVATTAGGAFSSKRVFLSFDETKGYPDGMDVDGEGNLWVAFWDGAAVRKFSPEGALIEEFPIPAPRPTSVALVGDRAYVTSARSGLSAAALAKFPLSGGLFEITLAATVSSAPRYFEG